MRPYLFLCAVSLIAVSLFAQESRRPGYGYPYYGYGPNIPLITTPMVSLETVSPNPVGASNATTGLIAGATNSTLSEIEGSTSSVYTQAVWYQGGAPLTTSEVNLFPESVGGELHPMMYPPEGPGRPRGPRKEEAREWLYFSGPEHTANVAEASAGKGSVKPDRHYNNDDVSRQNDNNGKVHYDGKTEKIQ